MITQEKLAAVTRGLSEAFGVTELEDIRVLTGGLTSSLVFRIVVRGSPYVLRIIMRTDDPAVHYTCMRAAAEAGLAPRVRYSSIEDKIAITDFVEAVSFPITDALVRMPATLRALHALPPFPGRANHINTSCVFLLNKGPAVDGVIQRFKEAKLLPHGKTEELLGLYEQVAAVYRRQDADMVSSHNDLLRPENVLFDGHRVWLVDWEAAFLNDRYADLAVVANFVVDNDAEEQMYLQEYFGQPPDENQLARLFLMQQVTHVFYTIGFLLWDSSGEPLDLTEKVPAFKAFHRSIWAGEVNLADKPMRALYGRVHWEQLLRNAHLPRFSEALRIVSDRQAPG